MAIRGDRIKLHCYYDATIYEGIKECGAYTVVLLLVTTEEKSVGYTVFLHLNEGRKECVGTLFFSILMKEERSVEYTVFLRV